MNETILQTLTEFSLDDYRPIVRRHLDLGPAFEPRRGNLVKIVTGMRRSGKSYRLLQEIDHLVHEGIDPRRICYFNFDDDRLKPITPRTGDELLEAFYALCPEALEAGAYLFLDELQEMKDWGAWLRRIVDTRRATIYVSGSSSKMLSSEISTEFRGRAIDFELLPYSLSELAQKAGLPTAVPQTGVFATADELRLKSLLSTYLDTGGFPDAQGLPATQAVSLLQSYVRRVVGADVVERHGIKRPRIASLFAQRALSTNAKPLSLRKIENDLRSAGIATSRELLSELLGYYEEAYLLFQVREATNSLSENTTANPKVYAIDPGLALANTRAGISDLGQRLENAVYLELRRRTQGSRDGAVSSLRTHAHGYEVDFFVGDALTGAASGLYQVSVAVQDPKTLERETRALWEAMDERDVATGLLIVGEGHDAQYELGGRRIVQVPAWKWLLGQGR